MQFGLLKLCYLFILILTIILIAPAHVFPPPLFMPLRFPHYLKMMGPFLGVFWPATFEIYHYAILTLATIGSLNVLGITFPKFKNIAIFSSLIGLFLISLMVLFFFFQFTNVNPPTAVIYGFYSMVLLVLDFLTFKALLKEQKGA